MKRLGLIARADNSGLGTLSREFYEHFRFTKVLVLDNGKYRSFPERFPGARVSKRIGSEEIEWLLDGIDILVTLETPYEWQIYNQARKRGVKTILVPMYECEPNPLPAVPTLVVCPSALDYRVFRPELRNKCLVKQLDIPVNRERVEYRIRKKALVFQHNAGHGGLLGRNGTTELLAAIPMCKSDAKFIIYSQKRLDFSHPNVEVRVGNYPEYWDLWGDGDMFVFPHKFDGLSLPIQEALSSGMPVLSTAIFPFTMMMPEKWMFTAHESMSLRAWDRYIDVAVIDPQDIADTIDQWYGKDIREESRLANSIAEKLSWKTLGDKWKAIFDSI